jgi:pyoverdine/dityrosine biosynthesis protein Dit1
MPDILAAGAARSRPSPRSGPGTRDAPLRRAGGLVSALLEHRRVADGTPPCPTAAGECCVAAHLPQATRLVASGRPIQMVIPAFPAKSPSPRKVLGVTPDLAEEEALKYLQSLCDRLSAIYRPGVRITICSDGRVFGNVVGLTDEHVTEYGAALRGLIAGLDLVSLDVFNLEDAFGRIAYDEMRRRVCADHGEPLEVIRARVHQNRDDRRLFNGIHRFLVEDLRGVDPERSRTSLRALCKDRAYQVIQRSQAWSELVARRFPDAMRLSIHPQRPHAGKLGIRLADETADAWITPWHGVALYAGGRYTLTYRQRAEDAGARLVYRHDRPSHYVLP